jgi:hypothetical protein
MKNIPSFIVLVVAAVLPATVHAQNDGPERGMRATAIVGEAGLSNDTTNNNGWWGGMALWQPTHRVGIAVSGRWVDAGAGANGFAADISTELGLVSKSSRSVPYVRFGMGAYRATFDLGNASRVAAMPDFYRRRLDLTSTSTIRLRETFMDPMLVVAAGMDVPLNRRVSVRPDVRGMWVVRDGRAYQMVLVGVQLAYHIEAHPATPSRVSR